MRPEYDDVPTYAEMEPVRARLPEESSRFRSQMTHGFTTGAHSSTTHAQNSVNCHDEFEERYFESPKRARYRESGHKDILSSLLRTIDSGGVFDSFRAGCIVLDAYNRGVENANEIVDKFVNENASRVSVSTAPEPFRIEDPQFFQKLNFASYIQSKFAMSHGAATKVQLEEHTGKMGMARIGGTPANFTRDFYYPTHAPFSGEKIEVDVLPRSTDEPAHLVLKRLFVSILAKSCINQSDICELWVIGENGNPGKKRVFPLGFFKELRQLGLEYFHLHDETLKTPWRDSYISLSFLINFPSSQRKLRFEKMKSSRQAYESKCFQHYLKEALREMRYGSFADIQPGESHRRFLPRQRHYRNDLAVEEPAVSLDVSAQQENQSNSHEPEKILDIPLQRGTTSEVTIAASLVPSDNSSEGTADKSITMSEVSKNQVKKKRKALGANNDKESETVRAAPSHNTRTRRSNK